MKNTHALSPRSRQATASAVLLVGFYVMSFARVARGATPQAECSSLKTTFSRANTSIVSAQVVDAGTYIPANPRLTGLETQTPPVTGLPTFCRVIGVLTPTSDSKIGIEVWMPISGWNGKLESIANHESGGIYYYGDMGTELKKNFAVASMDTGHTDTADANWAVGHPEKVIDLSWRAAHEMTVAAKAVIAAFYGSGPRYSYYNGCSTGGRMTLREAQQFPGDYDGIISGSGFHYWSHQIFANIWKTQVLLKDGVNGPSYLPPSKQKLVVDAAMVHCNALKEALTDSFLSNPGRCDWNPQTLVCKTGEDPNTCITAAQAVALEKIYEPLRNPRTHEELYPGATRTSEPNWADSTAARLANPNTATIAQPPSLQSIVFSKTNLDWRTMNFDTDVASADKSNADGPQIDAINPDLSKFRQHGGKIIEYQGWLDSNLAPYAIEHYENVVQKTGKQDSGISDEQALKATQDFYRLFVVPGLGHCRGGAGPNSFGAETHPAVPADPQHDVVSAIQEWVEHGVAPKQIIGTKYVKDDPKQGIAFQRPLCPYPQEAHYKGSGSTADAKNFVCMNVAKKANLSTAAQAQRRNSVQPAAYKASK